MPKALSAMAKLTWTAIGAKTNPLAVDSDENEETKAHHKFPYGDFKKIHRDGVIAAKQRAAQYDYHAIEKAADVLLEMIDKKRDK